MNRMQVACAVIIKDDKVFCCKRGPGKPLEGLWEFPGGKIESGESSHETVAREIKEELNSDVFPEYIICSSEASDIYMIAVLCSLVSGNLELTEHTDSKWLALDDLDSVVWADADKPVVDCVKKLLAKQKYTIGFDKESPSSNNWKTNLEAATPALDIVWTSYCSEVEAQRKFRDYIKKQSHEFHDLKTITAWKVIRLYDEAGNQTQQES